MPTYIYETIPLTPEEEQKVFEIKQSMTEAPLQKHPETGQPIRRVITGGIYAPPGKSSSSSGDSCCSGSDSSCCG